MIFDIKKHWLRKNNILLPLKSQRISRNHHSFRKRHRKEVGKSHLSSDKEIYEDPPVTSYVSRESSNSSDPMNDNASKDAWLSFPWRSVYSDIYCSRNEDGCTSTIIFKISNDYSNVNVTEDTVYKKYLFIRRNAPRMKVSRPSSICGVRYDTYKKTEK